MESLEQAHRVQRHLVCHRLVQPDFHNLTKPQQGCRLLLKPALLLYHQLVLSRQTPHGKHAVDSKLQSKRCAKRCRLLQVKTGTQDPDQTACSRHHALELHPAFQFTGLLEHIGSSMQGQARPLCWLQTLALLQLRYNLLAKVCELAFPLASERGPKVRSEAVVIHLKVVLSTMVMEH